MYSFMSDYSRVREDSTKKKALEDPFEWYQEIEGWAYRDLEFWIDRRWAQFLAASLSANVKRLAILEAWGTKSSRGMKAQLGPGAEVVIDRIQRSWLAKSGSPAGGQLRRAFA